MPILKQSFIECISIECINDNFQKIDLNRPYYFFSDMINIRNFNPNLLSIDKISYKNTGAVVYSIKYVMMKSINNQNIDNENILSLIFSDLDGHIIEKSWA